MGRATACTLCVLTCLLMAAWAVPTFFMDWHVLKAPGSDLKIHMGLFSASFLSNKISLQTLQDGVCDEIPSSTTLEAMDSVSSFIGMPAREAFVNVLNVSGTGVDPCSFVWYLNQYGYIIAVTAAANVVGLALGVFCLFSYWACMPKCCLRHTLVFFLLAGSIATGIVGGLYVNNTMIVSDLITEWGVSMHWCSLMYAICFCSQLFLSLIVCLLNGKNPEDGGKALNADDAATYQTFNNASMPDGPDPYGPPVDQYPADQYPQDYNPQYYEEPSAPSYQAYEQGPDPQLVAQVAAALNESRQHEDDERCSICDPCSICDAESDSESEYERERRYRRGAPEHGHNDRKTAYTTPSERGMDNAMDAYMDRRYKNVVKDRNRHRQQ